MGFPGLSLFFLWVLGEAHASAITMTAMSSNNMIDRNFKGKRAIVSGVKIKKRIQPSVLFS
jgi:hypothetical protein